MKLQNSSIELLAYADYLVLLKETPSALKSLVERLPTKNEIEGENILHIKIVVIRYITLCRYIGRYIFL